MRAGKSVGAEEDALQVLCYVLGAGDEARLEGAAPGAQSVEATVEDAGRSVDEPGQTGDG